MHEGLVYEVYDTRRDLNCCYQFVRKQEALINYEIVSIKKLQKSHQLDSVNQHPKNLQRCWNWSKTYPSSNLTNILAENYWSQQDKNKYKNTEGILKSNRKEVFVENKTTKNIREPVFCIKTKLNL